MEPKPGVIERQAFTIREFCKRNRIAPSTFFKLKAKNRAPRLMTLGRAIRISAEAERAWQMEREQPADAELRLIKREEEGRARRARKAAKASTASPNHISKRNKAGR